MVWTVTKSQTYTVASAPSVTGLVFMRKFRLFLAQCLLWWDNGKHILLCAAHLIWPGFIITQILIHIVNLFGLTNCTLKDKVTLFFIKNSTRAPCEQQAKTVSRRYSRKRKISRNRFCLFIWGPGRIFLSKNYGQKSRDTVKRLSSRYIQLHHWGPFNPQLDLAFNRL